MNKLMKGLLLAVWTVWMAAMPALSYAKGGDDDKPGAKRSFDEYITPGWVVVKLRDDMLAAPGASKTGVSAIDRVAEKYQIQSVGKMFPFLDGMSRKKAASLPGIARLQRVFLMKIDERMDPRQVAAAFHVLPEVEYAEPLYRDKIEAPSRPAWFEPYTSVMATPNDPRFTDMSHLVQVKAPEAWDVVKGESGDVVIAVVDGGTAWNHADLKGNVWVNPGEIAGNGVDDDGNDFIDDVNGWNFANDTNDPTGLPETPTNASHGTETASVLGAVTNNSSGIAGITWNAKYMPVNASCPETDVAICYTLAGILYGALNGADVISASLGGPVRSFLGQDVVNTALENGSLVVAAAGNDGANSDITPQYPGGYKHVLSVGATNKNFDSIVSYSNYGISVDIYAPGVNLDTATPPNLYTQSSGTSFATPMVAGVAALVKQLHPDWTPLQVGEQVRATADDISARNNTFRYRGKLGKGRLNAFRAVTEATPSVRAANAFIRDSQGSGRIDPGEMGTVTVDVTNFLEPVSDLTVTLESTSNQITVLTPTATIPTLNPGDTSRVEFDVVVAGTAPYNLKANLNTRFASGDYKDVDGFPVTVNSTIHDTGVIELFLSDDGNLGWSEFQDESTGSGFRYLGFDYMFEGGLIMGNGTTRLADNVRGEGFAINDDFTQEEGSEYGIIDGRETSEEGALQVLSSATTSLNLRVNLDSYADTSEAYNDFVILRYTVDNLSASDIDNFHLGLFFDWDSYLDPYNDYMRYDADRRMGVFNNFEEDVYIATKLLSSDLDLSYRAVKNSVDLFDDDGFTKTEKWNFISSGVQIAELDTTDVSVVVAGNMGLIPAGGSRDIAFALITGDTPENVRANADNAQQLWDDVLKNLGPNPVAVEDPVIEPAFVFSLEEPYPNPAREEATIEYQLPAAGTVQLRIYDLLGREVRTLVDGTEHAGNHAVTWDGRDNNGFRLASGVYMLHLAAASGDELKSATRKVVLVR